MSEYGFGRRRFLTVFKNLSNIQLNIQQLQPTRSLVGTIALVAALLRQAYRCC
jgi:hypothetical protein